MTFKPRHFARYREIGRLIWRHSRSSLFRQLSDVAELRNAKPWNGRGPGPEDLANELEAMGPTFVKLGQILSSRADLLPEPYLKALSRLQDKVGPFPFSQVEATIERELGIRMSKAFLEFDAKPIAAASLGQVHRAVLRDGREVAVKVQRPEIREKIAEDLEVFGEMASFLDAHTKFGRRHRLAETIEQFRKALIQELDYEREAGNLLALEESMGEFPRIRVAHPIHDYTARAVLTMTYLHGQKITELNPITRLDFDGGVLADELLKAYLKQILVDGLFHADPHPGNVLFTEDRNIGLLDLGMVGRVTPQMQERLTKLLLAVSEGRAEESARLCVEMSETADDFDESAFLRKIGGVVAEVKEKTLHRLDPGRVVLDLSRCAGETGLFPPSELTMLGKTLLQLHDIGRALDPGFDPNAAVRRHVRALLNQRLKKEFTPGNFFSSFLEAKEFVSRLPLRINKVFDAVGKGQVEFKLRHDDTLRVLDGFQKIANRITTGLILAALIIGAALLMRVPTDFHLFGYPGLAILFFIAAAAGGIWLLSLILINDTKNPGRD